MQRPWRTLAFAAGLFGLLSTQALATDLIQQEFTTAVQAHPDWMHGNALFNDICIRCHNPDGGGQAQTVVPAIAGQHFRVIVRQLVNFRHGLRSDIRMQHSTGRHHLVDAQDIADVASYVSSLPPTQTHDTGDDRLAANGRAVYQNLCASCHGVSAGGDARGVPALAGQDYRYLLRQMQNALSGERQDFPPEHTALLQRLEQSDLEGIAQYLARLRASGHRTTTASQYPPQIP